MIEFLLSIQFCNVQIAHFDKNKGSILILIRIRIEPNIMIKAKAILDYNVKNQEI